MSTLARRFWRGLIGMPAGGERAPAERGIEGYGLWRRFWSGLLGFRLPPLPVVAPPPGRPNPLAAPRVDGSRIRLPRFDRAALRLAAPQDPDRLEARWTAAGRRVTIRESGPGEIELLVAVDRDVPATELLPVDVTSAHGEERYYLVFVAEPAGGSAGALRLSGAPGWVDVSLDEELPAEAADLAAIPRSIAATPDPGMATWARIVASRPEGDRLRQVIEDAAG
ncbi:hypothetical protein [Actinoplanes aureus]|uniref:Uncharacterized protein n=1 Tax=Actinoplanes aureus TaxID=2792083 RepID=A0A931C906_9ACTN|nr:hypothetical protein [Actinoplanes aureus]MBG0564379.1 hypothetical protein [Actinoplanes aureus]